MKTKVIIIFIIGVTAITLGCIYLPKIIQPKDNNSDNECTVSVDLVTSKPNCKLPGGVKFCEYPKKDILGPDDVLKTIPKSVFDYCPSNNKCGQYIVAGDADLGIIDGYPTCGTVRPLPKSCMDKDGIWTGTPTCGPLPSACSDDYYMGDCDYSCDCLASHQPPPSGSPTPKKS